MPDPATETGAPPLPSALPVPGYDSMSLAALRARLRGLDAEQVRVLLEYERATLARADVTGMFERRIGKLTGTASDAT